MSYVIAVLAVCISFSIKAEASDTFSKTLLRINKSYEYSLASYCVKSAAIDSIAFDVQVSFMFWLPSSLPSY
jgi:hypothetical protein